MTIERNTRLSAAVSEESSAPARRAEEARPGALDRKITVTANGPYVAEGAIPLANQTIERATRREGPGIGLTDHRSKSPNSITCAAAGNRRISRFVTVHTSRSDSMVPETASRAPYLDQADVFEGPAMDLTDAQPLCASGRFCDPDGSIWNLMQTDSSDAQQKVKHQSGHCPSGRLVIWDKATWQPVRAGLRAFDRPRPGPGSRGERPDLGEGWDRH
jgi:hypothetical protein